jgi:hypothetical protein
MMKAPDGYQQGLHWVAFTWHPKGELQYLSSPTTFSLEIEASLLLFKRSFFRYASMLRSVTDVHDSTFCGTGLGAIRHSSSSAAADELIPK